MRANSAKTRGLELKVFRPLQKLSCLPSVTDRCSIPLLPSAVIAARSCTVPLGSRQARDTSLTYLCTHCRSFMVYVTTSWSDGNRRGRCSNCRPGGRLWIRRSRRPLLLQPHYTSPAAGEIRMLIRWTLRPSTNPIRKYDPCPSSSHVVSPCQAPLWVPCSPGGSVWLSVRSSQFLWA